MSNGNSTSDGRFHGRGNFILNNDTAQKMQRRTGDDKAYIADITYNTLRFLLEEAIQANKLPRLAGSTMTALNWTIKAAIEMTEGELRGKRPDETHHDYWAEMKEYTLKHFWRDMDRYDDNCRRVLRHVGIDLPDVAGTIR